MVEETQRRLSAIVSADVVGYSRLMSVDETGTLTALRAHRTELIDNKIAEHGGRIVKTMGDGLLLDFPSVVEATQCMIEIQQGMAERNEGIDEARRITFRIGVNLGDIIVEGADILGDAVNVAARLQEFAEPGAVAISSRVHDDVRDRLDTPFVDSGDQFFKNIARPIRVWQWMSAPLATAYPLATAAPLPLPSKPSIAVLPFDNMSGDPEQGYFADGVTEDIITALSKFRWFFVTARNSTFTYKGQAVDVKQIGRELWVKYVLEGSVRKAGNRVRITAQFIACENGNHLWADRYDGELEDLFDLQDQITESIVREIEPELGRLERQSAKRKTARNLTAWDLCMRGLDHFYKADTVNIQKAIAAFAEAVDQDPDFALARAYHALSLQAVTYIAGVKAHEVDVPEMLAEAHRAVACDPNEAIAHLALGRCLQFAGDPEGSVWELQKAVELNPNLGAAYWSLGQTLQMALFRVDEAQQHFDRAIRLSPDYSRHGVTRMRA
jgi:adenylate cyclase